MKADDTEFVAKTAEFARAADYNLRKNAELYRRLV
jgi:hypothetical protein